MTLKTCNIAAITLLAASMSGVSSTEQGANEPPPLAMRDAAVAHKATLAGVPNFGEVSPTLYRGGHPTEAGFERLAELGIKIVVDARGGPSKSEQKQVTKLGMQYVSIPWRCFHPQDQRIARFLAVLHENRGKKVFVHCRMGDDRTGLMIATYRMAEQGWTAEEAMREMKAYGFSWAHRYLICPGLASYEAKFPTRFQESPAFQDVRGCGRGAEVKP
jgi:tyrosine-protein phosphatase SIW14